MKIGITSVFVNDPREALKFYTEVLGFEKKLDITELNYITVVSKDDIEGTQLLLEPNQNKIASTYQKQLYENKMAVISLEVNDIKYEYDKLSSLGVKFIMEPTKFSDHILCVLDDQCGNYVQLYELIDK